MRVAFYQVPSGPVKLLKDEVSTGSDSDRVDQLAYCVKCSSSDHPPATAGGTDLVQVTAIVSRVVNSAYRIA
jgi:hypothetical protein